MQHENVLIILHSQIYSNHSITEGATFPTTSGSGSKMTGDGVSSVIPGCGVTKSPISVVKPGEAKSSSVTIKSFIQLYVIELVFLSNYFPTGRIRYSMTQ